jgi:hypothetical protein
MKRTVVAIKAFFRCTTREAFDLLEPGEVVALVVEGLRAGSPQHAGGAEDTTT